MNDWDDSSFDDSTECQHDECDDEGTCLGCGAMRCRPPKAPEPPLTTS